MAINFQKILKENIKVKTEIFTLLLEITKEFPLKTAFNVSLILLATFSEIIGIGLLIPFLEIQDPQIMLVLFIFTIVVVVL